MDWYKQLIEGRKMTADIQIEGPARNIHSG